MSRPLVNNVHASELRESLFPSESGIVTLVEDV